MSGATEVASSSGTPDSAINAAETRNGVKPSIPVSASTRGPSAKPAESAVA